LTVVSLWGLLLSFLQMSVITWHQSFLCCMDSIRKL
jgi:hypothetical protein